MKAHPFLVFLAKNKQGRALSIKRIFDPNWYLGQNPDVSAAKVNPLKHYLEYGWREGRHPHPLFDPQWYLDQNPDVAASGSEPLQQYLDRGWREGRRPHPLFDPKWYIGQNPDVSAGKVNPLKHYLEYGWREGRHPHPLFDPQWYLDQNPDVAASGREPLQQYLDRGWREGRRPHPLFDPQWYLDQNPDVAASGREPLSHFLHRGAQEGRRAGLGTTYDENKLLWFRRSNLRPNRTERNRRAGITIHNKESSEGRREKITVGLDLARLSGLEIGPLTSPVVRKSDGDITYVDHVGTEALRTKYSGDIHVDPSLIVDVDVIWEGRDLPTQIKGGAGFDYIIACHVIEHVPDLVHWLSQLRSVLKPEGVLRLVVPDRRFTFDRLRRETQLSDVIDAWLRCATRPSPLAVLDQGLNYREIDAAVVWRNGLYRDELNPMLVRPEIVQMAREVLEQGTYRDVHCWVFTPQSLGELFTQLCELRLLGFACEQFEDTEYGEFEFMLTMRPSNDQARTAASWRQVAATAFEASLPANDDGTKTRREFTSGA